MLGRRSLGLCPGSCNNTAGGCHCLPTWLTARDASRKGCPLIPHPTPAQAQPELSVAVTNTLPAAVGNDWQMSPKLTSFCLLSTIVSFHGRRSHVVGPLRVSVLLSPVNKAETCWWHCIEFQQNYDDWCGFPLCSNVVVLFRTVCMRKKIRFSLIGLVGNEIIYKDKRSEWTLALTL